MFSAVRRAGETSLGVMLGLVFLYFVSYGPVLAYVVRTESQQMYTESTEATRWKAIDAVISIYRPLALIVPAPVMRKYTQICGLSDIEAFFFVQALRSGAHLPDDLGIDIQYAD